MKKAKTSKTYHTELGNLLFGYQKGCRPLFEQTKLSELMATTPQYGRKLSRSFMSQMAAGKLHPTPDFLGAIAFLIREKFDDSKSEVIIEQINLAAQKQGISKPRGRPKKNPVAEDILVTAKETLSRVMNPETVKRIGDKKLERTALNYISMKDAVGEKLRELSLPSDLFGIIETNPVLAEWMTVCGILKIAGIDRSAIEDAVRTDSSAVKLALHALCK